MVYSLRMTIEEFDSCLDSMTEEELDDCIQKLERSLGMVTDVDTDIDTAWDEAQSDTSLRGFGVRKRPSKRRQSEMLELQKNKCLYCLMPFGSVVTRGGLRTILAVRWDHRIPFSISGSCSDFEFIAACQICNGLKGTKIFNSLREARDYMEARRIAKKWFF